jgi:cytoskeletal protein CcmA (bactofilin family)
MFSKASKQASVGNTSDSSRPAKNSVPSIISADLRITGDLVCAGDVQVDGWVEGDIQSRSVVIGEGATVPGAVHAEKVRICGLVKGEVKGDAVILEKTAKVTGDILHKSIAIEQGAFLEGMCKRLDASVAQPAPTPANEVKPLVSEVAKPLASSDVTKPLAERIAAIS